MIGVDPRFPQMAAALDLDVMGPLLDRALGAAHPDGAVQRASWRIGEKRYKPGQSLVISYRLEPDGAAGGQPRYATGRLCLPGEEANRALEREQAKRPGLDERALRVFQDPAMLLWVFPHDRKLVHLPRLLDESGFPRLLAPKLKALGLDPLPAVTVTSRVLHYLPERSCMIRYRVQVRDSATGEAALLYAKNYADEQGAEVYSLMRQLEGQFPWGAQALAYDGPIRTLWQSHVPGSTPAWADLQGAAGLDVAGRMGRCVAALHACTLVTERRVTQGDIAEALRQTVYLAEQSRPGLAAPLGRLVEALLGQARAWTEARPVPIHHDLKLNNFLVAGDSLGLIDLDCLCLGDPLADLASLIANLYLNGLREGAAAEAIHPVARSLVDAYRGACRQAVSLVRLRWQVAAALLHEVLRRSLRQWDERRMAHCQAYLELSDRYFAACRQVEGGDGELI